MTQKHVTNTRKDNGAAGRYQANKLRCLVCGASVEDVDIDGLRWCYCDADRVRWCVGASRRMCRADVTAAEQREIMCRVLEYEPIEAWHIYGSVSKPGDAMSNAQGVPENEGKSSAHRLLTDRIRHRLPGLYSTENVKDPVAQVKFFSPWNGWTWYATEFDGNDVFFGLVDGYVEEWGYFSLNELESVQGPGGVPAVERDLHFTPTRISNVSGGKHSGD